MSDTYSGAALSVVDGTPASNDQTGFEALTWVPADTCALRNVPAIRRTWDKVVEDLVCNSGASYDKKGGYKWDPVTFLMSRLDGDALQDVLVDLESNKDTGSFRLVLPGDGGTIYFTAQVSMFAMADGGDKNTIHSSSVELLIQNTPVFVSAS